MFAIVHAQTVFFFTVFYYCFNIPFTPDQIGHQSELSSGLLFKMKVSFFFCLSGDVANPGRVNAAVEAAAEVIKPLLEKSLLILLTC